MSDPKLNYSHQPRTMEAGAIGRTLKRGMGGAVAGGVVGGVGGSALLGIGAIPAGIVGALVGGVAGLASGMRSSDPQKILNRPLTIQDPLFGDNKTVYISAQQWNEIKSNLAKGFKYDELPPQLAKQFDAAEPPAPKA